MLFSNLHHTVVFACCPTSPLTYFLFLPCDDGTKAVNVLKLTMRTTTMHELSSGSINNYSYWKIPLSLNKSDVPKISACFLFFFLLIVNNNYYFITYWSFNTYVYKIYLIIPIISCMCTLFLIYTMVVFVTFPQTQIFWITKIVQLFFVC